MFDFEVVVVKLALLVSVSLVSVSSKFSLHLVRVPEKAFREAMGDKPPVSTWLHALHTHHNYFLALLLNVSWLNKLGDLLVLATTRQLLSTK